MNRRESLVALAALGAAQVAAAQPGNRVWRVGNVNGVSAPVARPYEEAFLAGMSELGYVPGRNLIFDSRHAAGDVTRYAGLVDAVIAAKPDILIGANTGVALVMKSRTATIPIVLATSGDAVGDGLAQSLARPGGNVTGVSLQLNELGAKHVELMAELQPSPRRIALLVDPPSAQRQVLSYERLARAAAAPRGIAIQTYSAGSREEIRAAFDLMQARRQDALVAFLSPRLNTIRREVVRHSEELRLPSIAHQEGFTQDGGLMSYGPSFVEAWRRVAYFVDRLLKGAKASDLPIEQPTLFLLSVNVKTADALGIKIPDLILLRADHVIR